MHFPRVLANCGKLHMASVLDGLEFKPHLGGHGDKAHYSRGVLHGARALTSNGMLPHFGRFARLWRRCLFVYFVFGVYTEKAMVLNAPIVLWSSGMH